VIGLVLVWREKTASAIANSPNHHTYQSLIPSPTFHLTRTAASLRSRLAGAILACMTLILITAMLALRFEPGTRVVVTVVDAVPVERYFVSIDADDLVVLNLTASNLPKRHLINMTIDHPDWMSATSKTIYKDNDIRVGPSGVFVKDRKLADLDQVVEHIPRARVKSIVRK